MVADATAHRRVIEDFLQAVRSGGKPRCDGTYGRRSLALVLAVYEAARTGRAVQL